MSAVWQIQSTPLNCTSVNCTLRITARNHADTDFSQCLKMYCTVLRLTAQSLDGPEGVQLTGVNCIMFKYFDYHCIKAVGRLLTLNVFNP